MNFISSNKIIYSSIIFLCIFLSFSYIPFQVSLDSGLVLSKIIEYPDPISPMKYYYYNSWTIINQFSEILLRLGFSVSNASRLILFLSSLFFALSAFIITLKITSKKFLALVICFLMLILQKNFGDTDYPSLIISNHTYGMISLAISSLIFSLILNGSNKSAGFFSTLLVSVHPVIGIWVLFLIFTSLMLHNDKKTKFDFIKGGVLGLLLTIVSLIVFLINHIGTVGYSLENIKSYMLNWDGHRNKAGIIHYEYLLKTLVLLAFANIYFYFINKNIKLFKNFFNISILFSTLLYLLFKFVPQIFPDIITRAVPTRFLLLHSFIGWPLILSILYLIFSSLRKTKKFAMSLLSLIILVYSIQHYKNFQRLSNGFNENFLKEKKDINNEFFIDFSNSKTIGYFITTSETRRFVHTMSLKPILLDTQSFDFIPYHPYLVDNVFEVLKDVYGVDLNNPPIRNNPYIPDSFMKNIFEKREKSEWILLSKKYNAYYVVVPSRWDLKLKKIKVNQFYSIFKIE